MTHDQHNDLVFQIRYAALMTRYPEHTYRSQRNDAILEVVQAGTEKYVVEQFRLLDDREFRRAVTFCRPSGGGGERA